MKNYFIKDGYVSRKEYCHYDDTGEKDGYQDQVYQISHRIMEKQNLNKILDIGCGSGYKLIKYFSNYDFTGLEIEPTLSWLLKKYPENKWELSDFDNPPESTDVIICSDVIEHLVDPDMLVDFIKKIDFKYAVISTPEREAIQRYQKGHTWDGPPQNPAHIREWAYEEFANYMEDNFEIMKHLITQNDAESRPLCQVVVVRKK